MSELWIVVLGNAAVGKSSLTLRFVSGIFVDKYEPTVQDSYRKQVEVDGHSYLLDIIDTAGQEETPALRNALIKNGQGFLLVYAITSDCSFVQTMNLHRDIISIKNNEQVPIVLVGNKSDQDAKRQVPQETVADYAEKHRLGFLEASAINNHNITEAFVELSRRIVKHKVKSNPSIADPSRKKTKLKCSVL